jgi:hypothetical protein
MFFLCLIMPTMVLCRKVLTSNDRCCSARLIFTNWSVKHIITWINALTKETCIYMVAPRQCESLHYLPKDLVEVLQNFEMNGGKLHPAGNKYWFVFILHQYSAKLSYNHHSSLLFTYAVCLAMHDFSLEYVYLVSSFVAEFAPWWYVIVVVACFLQLFSDGV